MTSKSTETKSTTNTTENTREAHAVALGIYKQMLMDNYHHGRVTRDFVQMEFDRLNLKDK